MSKKIAFIVFVLYMVFIRTCACSFSDENSVDSSRETIKEEQPSESQKKNAAELNSKEGEIKKLDKKAEIAEKAIEKKEENVDKVKKRAEDVSAKNEIIEKEVQLKEQEVELIKHELEAVKKEASITKNKKTVEKVKELSKEAEQIQIEAKVSKEKLETIKAREQALQNSVAANEAKIESLKKILQDVKKEKSSKRSFIEKSLVSAAIIVIGLIVFLLLKVGLRKFESLITKKDAIRENELVLRVKTISKLFNWLGGITVVGVILYMVLENHGINVAPLLAGAGIVGLAFGFGGQYLIRDLINGLFILVEGQYRINDVVKIGEYGGLVENINLRITTLRDLEGRVIIVPNGEIKTVVNYTKEYAQALFDIGVAYKEDVDKVMDVIKNVGSEMRQDKYYGKLILADLEMFGVDDFGDSQVTIKFRIKTKPIKQWEIRREFHRRLKNRFDELGIEIPFPHRTLYLGAGEDNNWLRQLAGRYNTDKK